MPKACSSQKLLFRGITGLYMYESLQSVTSGFLRCLTSLRYPEGLFPFVEHHHPSEGLRFRVTIAVTRKFYCISAQFLGESTHNQGASSLFAGVDAIYLESSNGCMDRSSNLR